MSLNVLITKLLFVLLVHAKITEISGAQCGTVKYIDPKITRGSRTVKGEWPFLVALFKVEELKFFCGGTLISAKNVLSDVTVLLGVYNLDVKIESGAEQRDVDQIFVHPDWKPFNEKYDADLTILVLSDIVDFTNYIRPICMPDDDLPVGARGTIVGWGLSENSKVEERQAVPIEAPTSILNDTYCYTTQRFLALFASSRTFCGGGEGGSPNKGDSGGGLFVLSNSTWIQYGIISASLSDARGAVLPDSFSIYTSVREFAKWIHETVANSGSGAMTKNQNEKVEVVIWCNYEIIFGAIYKCSAWSLDVTEEHSQVDLFTGDHLTGYSAQNVSEIWFWTGRLRYIPSGIGRKFPNLEEISIGYQDRNMGLRKLKRENFEDMEKLRYLNVNYNNVARIDEDTFRDLPNLKHFQINNNKLRMLQKKTFRKNSLLRHVNANSNQLEYLHEDLFKHNEMLEEAFFENNKLKTIEIDFTKLKAIKKIDFRGNTCIDKSLDDVHNVTEYQTLLMLQCRGISERHLFVDK